MNFTEQNAQSTLPQFSEISARAPTPAYISTGSDPLLSNHAVYTTASETGSAKQSLNKYQNTILNLAEPNAFIQFCEKPNLQTLNIPSYGQNNAVLNVQSQLLPMKVASQDGNVDKNEAQHLKNGNDDVNNDHLLSQQNLLEYLQNMRSGAIPLSLQQIMKIQEQVVKKERDEELKNDQLQNSILNIPSVQIYKTAQILNDVSYIDDNSLLTLKPMLTQNDVNAHHMESAQSENHNSVQTQTPAQTVKPSRKAGADNPKPPKKTQFRAKMGEIKVTLAIDGSPLYQCPECNLTFSQKDEINEHMQKHLMERKFKCMDCGAMLKRKEHLDQHQRTHGQDRPYVCKVCQKAFKRNEHLTRHTIIHTNRKDYVCQICKKFFSRKDHLKKHLQTHTKSKTNNKKVPSSVSSDALVSSTTVTSPPPTSMLLSRPEININSFLKEGVIKQEAKSQQFIQQMDSNKIMFSLWHEQMFKDGIQQAVNLNDILPQNTRYSTPS